MGPNIIQTLVIFNGETYGFGASEFQKDQNVSKCLIYGLFPYWWLQSITGGSELTHHAVMQAPVVLAGHSLLHGSALDRACEILPR